MILLWLAVSWFCFFLLHPLSFAQPIIILRTTPDLISVILLLTPVVTWPLEHKLKTSVYCCTIDLMKENHSNAQTCVGSSVSFQMGALSVDFVAALIITSMYPAFSLRVRRFHR